MCGTQRPVWTTQAFTSSLGTPLASTLVAPNPPEPGHAPHMHSLDWFAGTDKQSLGCLTMCTLTMVSWPVTVPSQHDVLATTEGDTSSLAPRNTMQTTLMLVLAGSARMRFSHGPAIQP